VCTLRSLCQLPRLLYVYTVLTPALQSGTGEGDIQIILRSVPTQIQKRVKLTTKTTKISGFNYRVL